MLGIPRLASLDGQCSMEGSSQWISWPGFGLDHQRIVVWFQARARDFSLLRIVPTDPGACPVSYSIDTKCSLPGVQQPRRELDCSLPSGAEVTNAWSYTFPPQYIFMVWCFIRHRSNFYSVLTCVIQFLWSSLAVLVTEVIHWCPISGWMWPMLCHLTC